VDDAADMTDFPPFRLDHENRCVWASNVDGSIRRLTLAPRAYDILHYLVDHAGRLITHDEFLDSLWRNVRVQPEVLKTHILAIRTALEDDSECPRFIETRRGRGYRFIAPVLRGAAEAPPQSNPSGHGAFVGRISQLNRLRNLFDEVRGGTSRIVFVAGESGIGKTRLVKRFLDSLSEDSTVLTSLGYCVEGHGGIEPYYPVLDALTQLIRGEAGPMVAHTLMSIAPSWALQMSGSMPQQYHAALQPQMIGAASDRMLREICEFLKTLSQQRSLVLVFEDLHWSDYSTVDMLSALARRSSHARLMIIGTYRPEDIEVAQHPLGQLASDLGLRKLCHDIVLEPLAEYAIAEYLGCEAPSERQNGATASFAQRMHDYSGGNPLFMVAMLDHLVGQGIADSTPNGWHLCIPPREWQLKVPPPLKQSIERRISRLAVAQQRALEGASVVGLVFSANTAAPAAGMNEEDFEDICEALCRQESFIRRESASTSGHRFPRRLYTFRHELYRQSLYDRQGALRTASSHLRIAEALEALFALEERYGVAAELAQHFAAAKNWERALDYLRIEIQAAKKRLAYRDALAVIDRALVLVTNLPSKIRATAEAGFLKNRASIFAAAHATREMSSIDSPSGP
jgi:predicted ATPase